MVFHDRIIANIITADKSIKKHSKFRKQRKENNSYIKLRRHVLAVYYMEISTKNNNRLHKGAEYRPGRLSVLVSISNEENQVFKSNGKWK